MISTFLIEVFLENLFLPAIFIFFWGVIAVNTYKDKCEFATRDLRTIEKNTLPPSWAESSIRDFYSDFSHLMQLGQSMQILISIINASFYYIYLPQYISLVLLLQAVVSSISGIVFLEIRHRSYPREIQNL